MGQGPDETELWIQKPGLMFSGEGRPELVVPTSLSQNSQNYVFFFKVVLTVQGPLHFLTNFRIYLSVSAKKKKQDFNSGSFESVDQFGKHYHLNIIK